MKQITLILKGLLLYTTIIVTMFYMCGIESIYDNGYFLPVTGLVAVLIGACYKYISSEEADILSGNKLLNNTK